MQNQSKPVLILAQSGRFLAQSASQAGYRVWVADCFGDIDTLVASERWQGLPKLASLTCKQFLTVLQSLTKGLLNFSTCVEFFNNVAISPDYKRLTWLLKLKC